MKSPRQRHPQYPNDHIPFLSAVTSLAGQEISVSIGDQKFSRGFYKIIHEGRMAFHLV